MGVGSGSSIPETRERFVGKDAHGGREAKVWEAGMC